MVPAYCSGNYAVGTPRLVGRVRGLMPVPLVLRGLVWNLDDWNALNFCIILILELLGHFLHPPALRLHLPPWPPDHQATALLVESPWS